jgi:MraZ protein
MTLGSLLCVFGLTMACKLRDGNRAHAQSAPLPPVAGGTAEPPALLKQDFGKIQEVIPTLVPLQRGGVNLVDRSETAEPPRALPPVGAALPVLALPKEAGPSLPSADIIPAAAVLPNTPTAPKVGSEAAPIIIPAGGAPLPPVSPAPPKVEVPAPTPLIISPPSVAPPAPVPPLADPLVSAPAERAPAVDVPGEPPLAPNPGPVMKFKVSKVGETFKTLAKKMLGTAERWSDIHKLNPTLDADKAFAVGTTLSLPADACNTEDGEVLRALPTLRPRTQPKARAVLPLTGTFSLTLDANKGLTLPRAIQQQFGGCDTVLVSPGSDRCLWITNQAHLDRLQAKLDKSPAREADVRGFKRLYYAQTVKVGVKEGRVQITDKLAQFASLGAEVVLVGIDDHFEVWDAARWRRYTETKKAASTEE